MLETKGTTVPDAPPTTSDHAVVLRTMAESLLALMEADDPGSIAAGLARVGEGLGMQRVMIVDHPRTGSYTLRVLYEWSAPGFGPTRSTWSGEQASNATTQRLIEKIERGKSVAIQRHELPAESRARFVSNGIHSSLSVPIWVDRRVWGQLALADCTGPRTWSEAEEMALAAMAAAFGVSIERQKVLHDADRQTERLRSLYAIVSNASLGPTEQIDATLELATTTLGMQMGLIQEMGPDDDNAARVDHHWSDGTFEPRPVMPFNRRAFELAARRGIPKAYENLQWTPWANHPVVVEQGLRSFIGAPIRVANEVYGALRFISKEPRSDLFTPADHDFVMLVAQWVGTMLERQRTAEQRSQLEEQLRATERLQRIGVAMGGVAHDFNNVLQVAQSNLQLAEDDLSKSHPAADCIGQARGAIRHAADLTQQMLIFAGRGCFRVTEVDLEELLLQTCELLHPLLPPTIELETECASDLPPVVADPTCVRQVAMNLLTNAIEATQGPGRKHVITVKTRLRELTSTPTGHFVSERAGPGTYVELEVSDTGPGIAEADLPRILEPFFSKKPTGRGLGLASVVGIVRSHRAALQISSEAGRGASFRVLWPAAQLATSEENNAR